MSDDLDMVTIDSEGRETIPVQDEPAPEEEADRRAELDALAVQLQQAYQANETLTINLAASQVGATVQDVEEVLDSYCITESGPEYAGKGQGGGWVPPAEMVPMTSTHIGYRWPDGSLNEEAFDIANDQHRELMRQAGIPLP